MTDGPLMGEVACRQPEGLAQALARASGDHASGAVAPELAAVTPSAARNGLHGQDRRRLLHVLMSGAAAWIWPVDARAQSSALNGLRIAVGGLDAMYHLPLQVALALDTFGAAGVRVEVLDLADDSAAIQALVSGQADLVCGAYEHTIRLQAQGLLVQSFVQLGRAPQVVVGLLRTSVDNARRLPRGALVRGGITAPGSSSQRVLARVLSRAGHDIGDVQWQELPTAASALAAVRAGAVDMISHFDPMMTDLQQRGWIRTVADTRTLRGTQELFAGLLPGAALYAPVHLLSRRTQACQAVAIAMTMALKWLQTAGPSDIIKTLPERVLGPDRAIYLAAFVRLRESISLDGVMSREAAETALRVLRQESPALTSATLDLAKTYTNSMLTPPRGRKGP